MAFDWNKKDYEGEKKFIKHKQTWNEFLEMHIQPIGLGCVLVALILVWIGVS